jgi:large subunit ribosomal protein L22
MGARKRLMAERIKEDKKSLAFAKLNKCPIPARKMRLVADLIRGEEVAKSLIILKHNPKDASGYLETLLLSAVANWQTKNDGKEPDNLFVKAITVGPGPTLKRIKPAPQGRAHRIRKRSNNVTILVDTL